MKIYDGNEKVYVGTIDSIEEGKSKSQRDQVIVTLEDGAKIYFVDSEKNKAAERVKKMKASKGSRVIIRASAPDGAKYPLGNSLVYINKGKSLRLKEGDDTVVVLVGYPARPHTYQANGKNRAACSICVDEWNSELKQDESVWYNVCFNSEVLPEKGSIIAVACTRYWETERGDTVYKNYGADDFTVIQAPKA